MNKKDMVKSALTAVKIVGGVAISIGVGAIVKNVVKATTPEDVSRQTAICIKVGSFFLAGVLGAATNQRFAKDIDSVIKVVEAFGQGHETVFNNDEPPIIDVEV